MSRFDQSSRGGGWDSLYVSLVPLPAALMIATLASDGLYWATRSALWSHLSEWLLGAGLASGAIAAADGLIRYVAAGLIRPSRICWMHVVGNVLALLLSLSNLVYRLNADRASAIVPAGIALSAIAVCLLVFTARLGRDVAGRDAGDALDQFEPLWNGSPVPAGPTGERSAAPGPHRTPAKRPRAPAQRSTGGS